MIGKQTSASKKRVFLTSHTLYGFLKLALFLLVFVAYPIFIFSFPVQDQPFVNKDTYYKLNDIFDTVGTKVELPIDETPAYIQLVDLEPFKHEPFFIRALPDDILIYYEQHRLGILFDPVGGKIINMSAQFQLPGALRSKGSDTP